MEEEFQYGWSLGSKKASSTLTIFAFASLGKVGERERARESIWIEVPSGSEGVVAMLTITYNDF